MPLINPNNANKTLENNSVSNKTKGWWIVKGTKNETTTKPKMPIIKDRQTAPTTNADTIQKLDIGETRISSKLFENFIPKKEDEVFVYELVNTCIIIKPGVIYAI